LVLDLFIKILYNSDIEEGDFVLIKYSKDSLKFLAKLDRKSVDRIRSAIAGLTQKPPVGDTKPMQGSAEGRSRLRVGGWRIIYKYGLEGELEILYIIDIGNRGDVYK
jgi:mRNA interferase RelE/StbE